MPIVCATALCLQLATGFTMQAMPTTEPTIVVAAYHPVQGCNENVEGMEFGSACREVPKPRDYFWVPCKDGKLECHDTYDKPKDAKAWQPQLPAITVTAPKRAHQKGKSVASKNGAASKTATAGASNSPSPSAGAQIADQLARQSVVYGAQMGGGAIGAIGGPVGAMAGSWLGCTFAVQGMLAHDYSVKERWDLHPEIAGNNFMHSLVGCSIVGFLQRAKEAETGRDRAVAMIQGLSLVPIPVVSLIGQLAPAGNAALSNLSTLSKGSSASSGWLWKPSKPYHDGPWEASSGG